MQRREAGSLNLARYLDMEVTSGKPQTYSGAIQMEPELLEDLHGSGLNTGQGRGGQEPGIPGTESGTDH